MKITNKKKKYHLCCYSVYYSLWNINELVDYCSEFIRIRSAGGTELFSRRGCDSIPQGLTVEIPFGGENITLAVLLSYRYSSARIQYTVLEKFLSSGMTFSITSLLSVEKVNI